MTDASICGAKACSKCGIKKPATLEYFTKKLDALTSWCKPCLSVAKRQAYFSNAEAVNARKKLQRSDLTRQRERDRYYRNREKRRSQAKARILANPERKREIDAASYKRNSLKRIKSATEWKLANRDRVKKNNNALHTKKQASDSGYRLKKSVSAYVYWCLKNTKQGERTFDILGYSVEELKSHLERQFLNGMTWDNYGAWHVDHILPVASFNFDSAEHPDFRACWALTNLRPLWAADNIAKKDKRLHLI